MLHGSVVHFQIVSLKNNFKMQIIFHCLIQFFFNMKSILKSTNNIL